MLEDQIIPSGRLTSAHDWSATGIGSPDLWCQELRHWTRFLAEAKEAMLVVWGDSGTVIFNDPFAHIIGDDGLSVLARGLHELEGPIWSMLRPLIEIGFKGNAGVLEDAPAESGLDPQAYYRISYTPIRGDDGGRLGVACNVIDRTAKIASKRHIMRQRDALEDILEQATSFIAVLEGPDHVFKFANKSYLRLVGERDLLGLPAAVALPEIVDQGYIELLNSVYLTGKPYAGAARPLKVKPAGSKAEQRYVNFIYHPFRDVHQAIIGIVVEGHDVSAQVQAQEHAERLRSELLNVTRLSAMGAVAAALAHEINQPLASAANYVAAARRSLRDIGPPLAVQHLEEASSAILGIGELIRSIRKLVRSGKLEKRPVFLKEVVEEAAALYLASADIGIHLDEVPPVAGDRLQLQQVFMNLIKNSCEASAPSKCCISINAREENDHVLVEVSDQGSGIDEAIFHTMFDSFVSSKQSGMGMGLAICRMVIEAHEGTIWAAPMPAGASICFRLPVAREEII